MGIILHVLLVFSVLIAIFAVSTKNLLNSVIAMSVFSASFVIIFIVLQAPDVALVEAVVATGITTGFFVITLNKLEGVK
ncbi:Na(+)/H(+) antiporter subunit B [Halonatronum saccharophilum]|uniref:Na(+)/H(+) antiporter subunit B n=1 Tax=Halonatronum saccharophilum TaxID=150060 RepID=UPI000486C574|nr:hydrogenase subunit MbhD domain-containing protein [Halonatronum saccharophilum]